MIRRRFARSDCGIFNLNVVFARDFLELIKQRRRLRWILEYRLMLSHPLVAFRPGGALFHVNSLLGELASPGGQLPLRARDCAPERTQNPKIEQHTNRPGDDPREHALSRVHSLIPRRHHLGFPSRRNWEW